ncbi:MAG: pentapeptide repeat-containing protein [Bacteroidetes bacterium]|nr:pentapeptide repeat-containing protein [Bacteroidota bacterium]
MPSWHSSAVRTSTTTTWESDFIRSANCAGLKAENGGASLDGASLDGASLDGASIDGASFEAPAWDVLPVCPHA